VAQETGLFSRNGLAVEVLATAGSIAQMTDFSQGKFEIAMTGFDNIVAYVEGQGEAPIGPQPEFFAFLGSDDSFLSLITQPGITSFEALRGCALSVDAATTGYAFVLYEMLRLRGLPPGSYRIDKVGGTAQRWAELQTPGGHAGTLVSAPFDILAKAAGFQRLARATDVIGPYQGNVAAARRRWAAQHPASLAGFARAYVDGIAWLHEPANKPEATAILARNVAGMTTALAAHSYDQMLTPGGGFIAGGAISPAGVAAVLALRSRYSPGHVSVTDPAKYIDRSYPERYGS
jgi:ABC-type nitrate/sulfonate/bicarbonate transport system substrate-binding protein